MRKCGNDSQARMAKAGACAKRGAVPDFGVAVKRLRSAPGSRKARLHLRVANVRKWTATSVQACATVSPKVGKVVGIARGGAIRFGNKSACWIVRRIKPKRARILPFEVRLRHRPTARSQLKVETSASGGNSNPISRRFTLGAVPRKQKKRARTASAPCASPQTLGVVFVTDDSASMESSDPGHLRAQAISVALDQLPDGSLVAATAFSDFSAELFDVTTLSAASRPGLKEAAEALFDSGTTDYDEAFLGAQEELAQMAGASKKAVVFLSDGAPNSTDFVADDPIAASGIPIYTIGVGVEESSEAESVLSQIAAGSGGQFYSATSAGQTQSIFARIVSTLTCDTRHVAETFRLAPGESRSIPFTVEPSDGEFRALAAWSAGNVTVAARRPDSTTMSPGTLLADEGFVNETAYSLLTATNPMIGGWQLVVTANQGNIGDVDVTIDVFKRSLPTPPPPPPAEGRRLDPCMTAYPDFKPKTSKIFGGHEKTYDRTSSLYFVCAGFGAPEELNFSPEMKCALIAAAAIAAGPPTSIRAELACNTLAIANAFRTGDWLGFAAGQACDFFGKAFATAGGVTAAGLAAASGPGAAAVGLYAYRALAAGMKVACGGLFAGGAAAVGAKIEADHQTNIAFDVIREGRCIAYREKFRLVSWRATDCR